MKRMIAIVLSSILLTALLPAQTFAEGITETVEVFAEDEVTILRAGNVEYTLMQGGNPEEATLNICGLIDKTVTRVDIPAEVNGYPVVYLETWERDKGTPFAGCSALTEIVVDPENKALKSVDGVLFSHDGRSLYAYPPAKSGDYAVPDGTYWIEAGAFWNTTALEAVTVPESLTMVYNAFRNSSVTAFCGAVPLLYANALQNCTRLRSITIRPTGEGTTGNAWFTDLPALESLTFTPDVVVQDGIAIVNCPKLRSVDFPQQGLPSDAGQRVRFAIDTCESLEAVRFYNSSLTRSRSNYRPVIQNCPSLREITIQQIPYVYAETTLCLEKLPSLKRITITELPPSVLSGTDPVEDPQVLPLQVGADCGSFTVAGPLANVNLCRWCERNAIPFESLDTQGDVNSDGAVTVTDAVALQKWLLGIGQLISCETADLNEDGCVDVFDLGLLKRMLTTRI